MTIHLLWTDRCLLAVLLLAVILIFYAARKEHVRLAYWKIARQPVAVSAGIVLVLFMTIGILDSVTIQTADFEGTVLDRLLAPVGQNFEKSYSKPMAMHLYSSQTVVEAGQARQIYPRLKFISSKIQTEEQKQRLLRQLEFKALGWSLAIGLLVFSGIVFLRKLIDQQWKWKLSSVSFSLTLTIAILAGLSIFAISASKHLHILGTGQIGQDIFYYTVKSIRTGLVIGLLTTLFMMPLALFLGLAAGYFGGRIDDAIQYVYTTLSSIPGVLLITASVLSMQTYIANHPEKFTTLAQSADARLLALCLILGVTSWTSLCRLIRAEGLKLREVDYVMAAKALGSSSLTILRKHLLPNVMHIVLITLVLDFSFLVLAEAVLSYVGVGVSPLTISWGNMINGARLELAREPLVWWPMLAAFILMFTLVLASNLFADAVRDAFDPRS